MCACSAFFFDLSISGIEAELKSRCAA